MLNAETILVNGKIYSVDKNGELTRGEAIAVQEGLIAGIGKTEDILHDFQGRETKIINCEGHTILPGLCDAHCHPSWAASLYVSCQLFDICGSPDETSLEVEKKYADRIQDYYEKHPELNLIRGIGWNRAFFAGSCLAPSWPTRHTLDKISRDKPIIMESYCQHALWVNSRALEMAGITRDTKDPQHGKIFREKDGTPSGILMEMEALQLIKEGVPGYDFSIAQYKEAFLRYQSEMASVYGVTLVNDCACTENAMTAYKELAKEGKLHLRLRGVYEWSDCKDDAQLEKIKARRGEDDYGDFKVDTVKIFLDGEPAMLEPCEAEYNIKNGNPVDFAAQPFYSTSCVDRALEMVARADMQVHIHAMGDAATRQAVRGIEKAQAKTGNRKRNIIAHLMAITDDDIVRMGKAGIIANCQPRWMIYDSDTDENYNLAFGASRAARFYPNKRFLDAGCVVAYGTDFPVTPPPSTFHNIQCALTRSVFPDDEPEYANYHGRILGPQENPTLDCVSLKDAVKSNSWSGAYQNFLEDVTGSIETRKSADLVVLSDDLESVDPEEIYCMEVEKTFFKGVLVYEKGEYDEQH